MDIVIKKGGDVTDEEFPLFSETLEYFDLIMDIDDFGVTYFEEHFDKEADYAVIRTDVYRQLAESSRRDLRLKIEANRLDGTQSPDELSTFIESLRLSTVDRVVADLTELHERGLTPAEKAEIDALVCEVEGDYHDAAARGLEELIANTNVGRMLDSDSPFLRAPPADEEMLEKIRATRMPAYFVLDVSYSMNFDRRIDYANAFVQQVSGHLKEKRIADDLKCLIYWGRNEFIDLMDPRRFKVDNATDTGEALRVVGAEIRARHYDCPVFLALVTDGLPNCQGTYQGSQLDPVEYTVQMASLLPDNVIFTQIAFAPLDPGDPDRPESLAEFEAYLTDLKRVTDVVEHGQTYVLVKQSEHHLPWLPLGAYQKAKHLSLVDQSFAVIEDI